MKKNFLALTLCLQGLATFIAFVPFGFPEVLQTQGHIRTFCASAVPAPQEDRLASSPVRLLDWVSFTFCHHSLP